MTRTLDEGADLERLTRTGKATAAKILEVRVLLLTDEADGGPASIDVEVMAASDVGRTTVSRFRERVVEEGVEAAIGCRPPGRAYGRRLYGRAEAHLVALACSEPPEGRARWTMPALAARRRGWGRRFL